MTETTFTASAGGTFAGNDISCQCAIGKGGVIAADEKCEGDGASPIGSWRMKRVFYRSDRVGRPKTDLPVVPLEEQDGWCDAPDHPLYNRPISLPFAASHEKLWREDHVYDLIVELAHNDAPIVPGQGSAIFFHLAHEDYRPTEGCAAIALDDMLAVLPLCSTTTCLEFIA